jgi:RecA-family ATPase
LLKQGAFSVLAAKPKQGQSSLSRYIATCVTKGTPCLGRDTTKGEVILVSLEDSDDHVDGCLDILGYDELTDAPIRILEELPSKLGESIELIETALEEHPDVRLVVIDTLSKFLRMPDLNNYSEVQPEIKKLRDISRRFPHVHIMAVAHCKKAVTDNVFDSLLGSTAIRGETDTTIALYEEGHQRIIATEVRRGRKIAPTILRAEIANSSIDGAEIVSNFILQAPLEELKASQNAKEKQKRLLCQEEQLIRFLQSQDDYTAPQQLTVKSIKGRDASVLAAINRLEQERVITVSGVSHSPTNPQALTLNPDSIKMYDFINTFDGRTEQ